MIPLEVLSTLAGLKLVLFVHFEKPDEILSNRDDEIFIERLIQANRKGKTFVTTGGSSGLTGHNTLHKALWKKIESMSDTQDR